MLGSVIPADSRRSDALAKHHRTIPIVRDTVDMSALVSASSAHDRSRFVVAVAVTVFVHVAVIASLSRPIEVQMGARGLDLAAISVEVGVVPAPALESLMARPEAAAGAGGPLDIDDGARIPPATPVFQRQERQHRADFSPSSSFEPAQIAVPPERTKELRPPADEPAPPKQADPAPRAPSASIGGSAARSIENNDASVRGATAVRSGEVQHYARNVLEALRRSRPRGASGPARGTVKVVFAIAEDGGVAFARVVMSSGSAQLDAAALAAVQKVRFPTPPQGMSMAQLTYEVPYHFR